MLDLWSNQSFPSMRVPVIMKNTATFYKFWEAWIRVSWDHRFNCRMGPQQVIFTTELIPRTFFAIDDHRSHDITFQTFIFNSCDNNMLRLVDIVLMGCLMKINRAPGEHLINIYLWIWAKGYFRNCPGVGPRTKNFGQPSGLRTIFLAWTWTYRSVAWIGRKR